MYFGDSIYSSNIKEIIPIKKSSSLVENEYYILECKDKNKRNIDDIDNLNDGDTEMVDVSMPQSSSPNNDKDELKVD